MIFTELPLKGAFIIDLSPYHDERGVFFRSFCAKLFEVNGLVASYVQTNNSISSSAGTIRGLHYQVQPFAEVKLLRCVRGSIYDVMVDIRFDSPTFMKSHSEILTSDCYRLVYVPVGFAHGFQTLVDDVEVTYQTSALYNPHFERQIKWDDPRLGIQWPIVKPILSPKDSCAPYLQSDYSGIVL